MKRFDYTPDPITDLLPHEVFVFGSNMAGHHYGGAANVAHKRFGAVWGEGEGLFGQSYAFPTLFNASTETGKESLEVLDDEDLRVGFSIFFTTVELYPEKQFLLTKIGTGIAGIPMVNMRGLFNEFYKPDKHPNLTFPIEFKIDFEDEITENPLFL